MTTGPQRVSQRQLQDEIRRRGGSDMESIAEVEERNMLVMMLAQGNTTQALRRIRANKQLLIQPVDKEGNLPIHVAALNGRDDLVSRLIEMGADPNARNSIGQTPILQILVKSVLMNSIILYRTLLDSGASLLATDDSGQGVVSSYVKIEPELQKLKPDFVQKLRPLLETGVKLVYWDRYKSLLYAYDKVLSVKVPLGLFRDIIEYW